MVRKGIFLSSLLLTACGASLQPVPYEPTPEPVNPSSFEQWHAGLIVGGSCLALTSAAGLSGSLRNRESKVAAALVGAGTACTAVGAVIIIDDIPTEEP